MRIGVLGGSFDPPHAAHAALASAARDLMSLDKVLWVPTFHPPHKDAPAAPFEDRLAMTRALAAEVPASEASDLEASLPPPSYTLRTLEALRRKHGEEHRWYLILGADNWAGFSRWHRPEAVLAAAALAVYPRDGLSAAETPPLPEGSMWLDVPEVVGRSRDYRARLAHSRDATLGELPAPVAAYIRSRGLYASRTNAGGAA